jgi:crotonobetainyl-CoA:carnitine CoA-transferase CaiB-like acyl-CoA transferase
MTLPQPGPLSGIRVADFSRVVAGPYSTYLLARMGAEVIKVEGVRPLDHTREVGPYRDPDRSRNRSGYFNAVNAGKKSITLHLQDPAQAALARQIAVASDIVVESFMAGTMERFGLGYEVLAEAKPTLVVVSCSGFGRTGPMRDYSAYMNTVAAYIGLTALNSTDGEWPTPVGATFSDLVAGTNIAMAGLLALRRARSTGAGAHIDLSMAEASMSLMGEPFMEHFALSRSDTPPPPERFAPRGAYRTRGDDKWIAVSVTRDEHWAALVRALGSPAWAAAPDLATNNGRLSHAREIDAHLSEWTRDFDNIELTERLQAAGVPALPASDPEDVVRNPHFRARGAMAAQDSEFDPGLIVPNLPWHFARMPENDPAVPPAPKLGEHNAAVLSRLTDATPDLIAELDRLAAEAAIFPTAGGH